MLVFDILFGILSIYFCWLDLFNIYYGGNQFCNIENEYNEYDYSQSSLVFILLSFILIHFIFIWLESFRFVEVCTK